MRRTLVAIATALAASGAWAVYPDKPITIVVPYAAGGPTDKVARDLADALRKPLGNATLVIENVSGAGGTLGATRVAKAAPDGYTLLLAHTGLSAAPTLYRHLPYDTLQDFEYLGLVNEVPMLLVGKPALPAGNVAQLIAWLRLHQGQANLAHTGLGSPSHLCGILFASSTRISVRPVPYKDTAPALADLVGGQVDLMCDQPANTVSQIVAGKVKAYAVAGRHHVDTPALARLPTLDEAGVPGFELSVWHGLYAPRGTPEAVLARLNGALRQALKDPDFVQREQAMGAVPVSDARLDGTQHRKFVEGEIAKWRPVIKAGGQFAD